MKSIAYSLLLISLPCVLLAETGTDTSKKSVSGIYPHLAVWNGGGECGIGGVYPWAGKIWVITYSPHRPMGSDDKLYSIDENLEIQTFEGSVGGTPANRMIHEESGQLVIGPYFIRDDGNVRVIPPQAMPGRHTGNARHLFDPANKVYFATMEEGFYEVDVNTLAVKELFPDHQNQTGYARSKRKIDERTVANLPGYHGKGLYSGQGRLIYSNNGESSPAAMKDPKTTAGCLAEWDGKSKQWNIVRRNQFVDIRGPGGLKGNANPDSDPVWAIGWDHRSLLLMLLDNGQWHTYRMPKATHTYDGAHGWNTEWPRFNDVDEADMVLNMHGMFWKFPRTFSLANSKGITPRSTYLKVVGDYCRWNDRIVFGCDDTAVNEFLNKRKAKGNLKAPGQSHSNLWFTSPTIFDELGAPLGRGAVWVDDSVKVGEFSDPYLFAGFERRMLCLANHSKFPSEFVIEVDRQGNNQWSPMKKIDIAPSSTAWHSFDAQETGAWIRIQSKSNAQVTACFQYSNRDQRKLEPERFRAVANPESTELSGGTVRTRGEKMKTLAFASRSIRDGKVSDPALYELDAELRLAKVDDQAAVDWMTKNTAIATGVLEYDAASVIYVDDDGNRWRLPKNHKAFDQNSLLGPERVDREVVTERDLFNCHGTFYELPARNAGGVAKIRPICTHNKRVNDYCSYRGMLVLTGIDLEKADSSDEHIVVSEDGNAALWLGVVDDLWKLGKPVGRGGPWLETPVEAGKPSDPYLLTGYDQKTLYLSQSGSSKISIDVEVDVTGSGHWTKYKTFEVSNQEIKFDFPADFAGYWLRFVSSDDSTVSAMLEYR